MQLAKFKNTKLLMSSERTYVESQLLHVARFDVDRQVQGADQQGSWILAAVFGRL